MSEGGLAAVPPGERGHLVIPGRVISKVAARSIELHGECAPGPSVEIVDLGHDTVELSASMKLPYPDRPLSPVLSQLRTEVAADLERLTGRGVRRLDLRVDAFVDEPRGPAPRVQ